MDKLLFENYELLNRCEISRDPLLRDLAFMLSNAWDVLVSKDEAESLMSDVEELIKEFKAGDTCPSFDEVRLQLFYSGSDCFRAAVKWASVYAGLAENALSEEDFAEAWRLVASSTLILIQKYQPRSVDAYNNYISRKGGAARHAQSRNMKAKLSELIEGEIASGGKRFNSKVEAAEHFAPLLNDAAKDLGIKNIKSSMCKTIRSWFSTDDTLKELIESLISATRTRRRL